MGSFWKTNPFGGVFWWGSVAATTTSRHLVGLGLENEPILRGVFEGVLAFGMVFYARFRGCAAHTYGRPPRQWAAYKARRLGFCASQKRSYTGCGKRSACPTVLGRLGPERFGLQSGGGNSRRNDAFQATSRGRALIFGRRQPKPWSRKSS